MTEIILVSFLSGISTGLGGLAILLFGRLRDRWLALLLGMAAGIMLAVVIFDLLPASLVYGGTTIAFWGFSLGCLLLWSLDRIMTKINVGSESKHNRTAYFRKLGYLIALGIALHDLPEGMAIAVGFETTRNMGLVIALAIALHNIPEGMATAAPLILGRISRKKILLINGIISLFTPLGTCLGLLMIKNNQDSIALLLACAAGAMTYIVKDELLPALKSEHLFISRFGLVVGFGLIMTLTLSGI